MSLSLSVARFPAGMNKTSLEASPKPMAHDTAPLHLTGMHWPTNCWVQLKFHCHLTNSCQYGLPRETKVHTTHLHLHLADAPNCIHSQVRFHSATWPILLQRFLWGILGTQWYKSVPCASKVLQIFMPSMLGDFKCPLPLFATIEIHLTIARDLPLEILKQPCEAPS